MGISWTPENAGYELVEIPFRSVEARTRCITDRVLEDERLAATD